MAKDLLAFVWCLLVLVVFAGCASTEVTSSQPIVNERLPRPNYIWVYDFVATPVYVPRGSSFVDPSYHPAQPQTSEEISVGRQAGAEVAAALVERIRDMGLPAERPTPRAPPQTNDIVIWGYFISLDEGNAVQRISIEFWLRLLAVDHGGRSLSDDRHGVAKARLGQSGRQRQQGPGGGLGGGELYYHRQPGGTHRRRRDESVRGGEWSLRGDRPGQGNRQGHRCRAQAPVGTGGLDSALSSRSAPERNGCHQPHQSKATHAGFVHRLPRDVVNSSIYARPSGSAIPKPTARSRALRAPCRV